MFLRGQYAREGIELPFRVDLRANFRSGLALRSRISPLVIGPLVSSTILRLIAAARADPSTLQPSLAALNANEPHLVQLVQQHQAEFVALLNSAAPPAPAPEP